MSQRTDNIFHDMTSEANGGSMYHNFQLTLSDSRAAVDTAQEVAWIAPRAVRIINNRLVATIILGNAQANTLDIVRNIGDGTVSLDRTVITQFDPDTLVADTVTDKELSVATADGAAQPHVVADQYQFFAMILGMNAATTGPYNITYMAHVSFEDL